MSRFLMTLAAVVVAGAMYVAAAPGSQQAGPSAAQFKALKKQVTTLQKQVKAANQNVSLLAFIDFRCMLHSTLGVAQTASDGATYGYAYTPSGGSPGFTTALDLSNTPTSNLLTLNPDPQSQCDQFVGLAQHRYAGALARWAKLHH